MLKNYLLPRLSYLFYERSFIEHGLELFNLKNIKQQKAKVRFGRS